MTSEKNIWGFWHNGFAQMKPWTQRNVINWVRRLGPEWTVHIVDRVDGSETNVLNYVEHSYLPKTFLEGTMDGHKAHMGGLVRLPLLWKYGGMWMDVGLILLRHVDDICWKCIEDPESPYELSAVALMHLPGTYTPLNGFLAPKAAIHSSRGGTTSISRCGQTESPTQRASTSIPCSDICRCSSLICPLST